MSDDDLRPEELFRHLREGEKSAWDVFYEKSKQGVRFLIWRKLYNVSMEEQEELIQEVFMRFLQALEKEKAIRDPGKFLLGIARNVIREYVRNGTKKPMSLPPEYEEKLLAKEDENPEHILQKKEVREEVQRILHKLRKKDRELLLRVYVEKEDRKKICEALGISREALRKRLFDIKQRIRRACDKNERFAREVVTDAPSLTQ